MNNKYLAIDIGGTKIEICKFTKSYELTTSKKYKTKDYPIYKIDFLSSIEKIISENLEEKIIKIGISFNCVVKNGVILHSSLLGGSVNYPLVEKFSQKFKLPICLENDVNAMAISENKFGKGKNLQSFILLNLGTGIRPSFVYENKLIDGFTGNTGEISQREIVVPELNNKIYKIDNFLSGRGISNIYFDLSGKNLDAKTIFDSQNKDDYAKKTISIFIDYFAKFLIDISYFYNPEKIIINGSLKKSATYFLPQSLKKYKNNTYKFFHFKEIVLSEIDNGACLGVIS